MTLTEWIMLGSLAGVFAGFACGAKLTAGPMLLVSLPIAIVLSRANRLKRLLFICLVFVVTGIVAFSPWLIRTAVWTHGNPVFPESTNLFGRAHWTEDQVQRWNLANHLPAPSQRAVGGRLSALWHQVIADYSAGAEPDIRGRYGYVLVPLSIVAICIGWRSPTVRLLAILLLCWVIFWTFFTHLQSRFLTPAIPVAALLTAQISTRRWQIACVAATVMSAIWCCFAISEKYLAFDKRTGGLAQVLGLEDLGRLHNFDLSKIPATQRVALVGDAKAFLYPLSIPPLSYTTVFDVVPSERSDLSAWRATDQPIAKSPTVFIVDPAEWQRLSRTYWKIPPPPAEVLAHHEPYIEVR
jgi:4-amino-4-deoxy-L-arabinose transferase-like glycosyltransferase